MAFQFGFGGADDEETSADAPAIPGSTQTIPIDETLVQQHNLKVLVSRYVRHNLARLVNRALCLVSDIAPITPPAAAPTWLTTRLASARHFTRTPELQHRSCRITNWTRRLFASTRALRCPRAAHPGRLRQRPRHRSDSELGSPLRCV